VWLPIKLFWRLTVGLLASVGIVGGTSNRSSSRLVAGTSTSLIVQPSATGGIPRFSQTMSAPSIAVGGGGRGAPGPQPGQPSTSEGGSMTEQIGRMAEDSQEQPRNPKKRLWDENVEAKKFEERQQKDEL